MSHNSDSDTVIYVLIQGVQWQTYSSSVYFIVEVILNNVCLAGQASDQCLDVQAECVTDYVSGPLKCLCKTGYYENSGSVWAQSNLSFFTETNIGKVTSVLVINNFSDLQHWENNSF